MKKLGKFLGIIALVTIIGFSMVGCDGGDNGGGEGGIPLPPNIGTNEVAGKTLYLGWWGGGSSDLYTTIFANTGTTFQCLEYGEPISEGLYSYNSTDKTITLAVEYIYSEDGTKMNKTQALKYVDDYIAYMRSNFDAVLREFAAWNIIDEDGFRSEFWSTWNNYDGPMDEDEFALHWLEEKGINIDDAVSEFKAENGITNADSFIDYLHIAAEKEFIESQFSITTLSYQITTDGSLLVHPVNMGINEVQGKTFIFAQAPYDSYYTWSFTSNSFSVGEGSQSGTYYYNSNDKKVWLIYSDEINGKTMLEYYEELSDSLTKEEKAQKTNDIFNGYLMYYRLGDPNILNYVPSFALHMD